MGKFGLNQAPPIDADLQSECPAWSDSSPPKRVFVLEDEYEQQLIIKRWFDKQRPDIAYRFFGNGTDLIECLQSSRVLPGLIILDVRTPPLDGIDTLKWVTANLPRLHASMFSGSPWEEEECIAAGAIGYYLKPFNPAEYGPTIDKIILNDYPLDPYSSNPLF